MSSFRKVAVNLVEIHAYYKQKTYENVMMLLSKPLCLHVCMYSYGNENKYCRRYTYSCATAAGFLSIMFCRMTANIILYVLFVVCSLIVLMIQPSQVRSFHSYSSRRIRPYVSRYSTNVEIRKCAMDLFHIVYLYEFQI